MDLGTVSNIAEGVEWLKYSYFYIRARLNPLVYGISLEQLERDPDLSQYLEAKIKEAAEMLDFNQMIRFDPAYVKLPLGGFELKFFSFRAWLGFLSFFH